MTMHNEFSNETQDWITLDVLCLFCRSNDLAIRFGSGEKQDWVSPLGVASGSNPVDVAELLRRSVNFEVCPMSQGKGVRYFVTRKELEQQLQIMMN